MCINFSPISNGWRVVLNRLFSPSRQTERWEERRKSPWKKITDVLSARPMVETVFWLFESGFLRMGLPNRFVSLLLHCIIQRGESKGRLQMPDRASLSQPVQRSTWESNWHWDTTRGCNTSAEKKQYNSSCQFSGVCYLSILISLHNELVVAMGTVLAAEPKVVCEALGFGSTCGKQSLENLELPNCQSAWLDMTLRFPSRLFVVVIYFISSFSNSLSRSLSEDILSVSSHFSLVHL